MERMAGTWTKVSRILSAAALVVLVAAGCGGAAQSHDSTRHGIPQTLARDWEGQASAIAAAAAAGNDCHALQLANALRADVTRARGRVPLRLRSPLVNGVNSLADRLVCTPPPPTVSTQTAPHKEPPPKSHGHHGDHGHHGHGHDKGDEG